MDPLTSRRSRSKKRGGFVGLEEEDECDVNDVILVEEILASEHGSECFEEEVTDNGAENQDPFVVNARAQSALTVPASNLAMKTSSSRSAFHFISEKQDDLAEYAELAVAKIVADMKSKENQKRHTQNLTRPYNSEPNKILRVVSEASGEPPWIPPVGEPPRLIPAPIFKKNNEPVTTPLEPIAISSDKYALSTEKYYSDPPATLIIESFRARSSPFASNDELSDISPVLQNYDEMTNTSGQEIILDENESEPSSASETERGSDSALILATNERSDDPELGAQRISPGLQKTETEQKRFVHQFLVFLLFVFVCAATGYLVVYMFDFFGDRSQAQAATGAGGQNENQSQGQLSDANFVGAFPTLPMDPYDPGCNFQYYLQPHVMAQCACNGEIKILADEVREKYYALNMHFIDMNISDAWDLQEESCDPRNQAMVWLATVYANDEDDLMQKFVLASFYVQMAGQQWGNNEGWLVEDDKCMWHGVSCSSHGSVAGLFLDRNGLRGSIPLEISLLQSLEAISLRNNAITGEIPFTLFSMPYINEVSFSFNNILGTIPTTIALASNLEILRLDMNSLEGGVPSFLGQLSMLKKLNIGYNQFVGTLPLDLFYLTNLEELTLEYNLRITGRLPPAIRDLDKLEHLDISNTNILARIPAQIGYLSNLRVLKAAESQMSGIIPPEIGFLTNLNHLDLSGSKFRRNIPTWLGQLPYLTYLSLSHNQFTGTIPPQLGNITELVHLSLHGNQLYGEIPKHLGYLTMLDTLTLDNNYLTGRAPREVCNLRREELIVFTTDCSDGSEGVLCPVPNCCTSCH